MGRVRNNVPFTLDCQGAVVMVFKDVDILKSSEETFVYSLSYVFLRKS